MTTTESHLLTTFLLTPAPLPTILSLKSFTALFPRAQQSSPQIRRLYRSLQHQRALTIDSITENIARETKRGNAQRRAVLRARKAAAAQAQDDDAELEVENFLHPGGVSNLPASKPHSLNSIIPEMEQAVEDVEEEIRRLEEEAKQLVDEMEGTVGGLSDLRFGRVGKEVRERVIEGGERLVDVCEGRG